MLKFVDISNWNVGDEIVVTSTAFTSRNYKSPSETVDETEQRTIASIDLLENKVTLTESLVYTHYGVEDKYTLFTPNMVTPRSTTTVNLVAEVGLLTRSIKF